MIHRDLKPENILYSIQDRHPKILDFGLVRAQAFDEFTTQTGIIQGTPAYISPEQIQGREVDPRADLYSLGVILFELLTGQVPFKGVTVMMLLEMHLKHSPPPPTSFNSLIPISLENTILKLLAKEPGRRFSTAAEVKQQLIIASEQVKAETREQRMTLDLPTMAFRVEAPDRLLIAPWVGKPAVLSAVKGSVTELAGGKGSFHLISGEHGSGKSRLLEEVKAEGVNRQAVVLSAQTREDTNLPYGLFQPVMTYLASKHRDVLGSELGIIARNFPVFETVTAPEEEHTLANLDPKGEKARLFHAVFTVFRNLAADRNVLLLLDDIHWADESSLELLNHLIYSFTSPDSEVPMMIAVSCIPAEGETNPAYGRWAKGKSFRDASRHTLGPLTREELSELVQALLGQSEPPPARFIQTLEGLTGGNPYFVTETLRAMIEDDQLKRLTGKLDWDFSKLVWTDRATVSLARLPMPKNIHDAIEYRLKDLSDEERMALQSAALIGKRFSFVIWASVVDLSEDELLDLADRMLAAKLLVERPNEELEFSSDQVRQILIESLSGLRKRRLHCKIADAILGHYSTVPESQFIPLATNLDACGRHEEALTYFVPAAEHASQNYHVQLGEYLWHNVAEISEELENQRDLMGRACGELGNLAVYSSRYDDAENFYTKAVDLFPENHPSSFFWKIKRASCIGQRGDIQNMNDTLTALLPGVLATGDSELEAWCRCYLGISLWEKGDSENSIEHLLASRSIFQSSGRADGALTVQYNLGIPYFYMGKNEEAEGAIQEALDMAEKFGDVRTKLVCLSNLLAIANNKGDLERSESLFEMALPLAESMGDWRLYAFILYSGATLENLRGNWERAGNLADKAIQLASEIGSEEQQAHALALRGEVQIELKAYEKARTDFEAAADLYAKLGLEGMEASIDAALGFLSVALEGDSAGMDTIQRVMNSFEEAGNHSDFCHAAFYMVKAAYLGGDTERASTVCLDVIRIADENGYRHIANRARMIMDALLLE